MKQIFNIKELKKLSKITENKKTVLVGGCFDILHLGHLTFLKEAKKRGDLLMVLLESDENIKKIKGKSRPINNQNNRAKLLIDLKPVDVVIVLDGIKNDTDYTEIIKKIRPNVIAISGEDNNFIKKKKQAKDIGAKLIRVTKIVPYQSTSGIVETIIQNQETLG